MATMAGQGTRDAAFYTENLGGTRVWPWFGGLLIVAVLLAGLRLIALRFNATDLFFDEAQYWFWSTDLAFGYYSKPPLIGWIISLATSFCGSDAQCVRAPSPILHSLTALGIFLAANALYGARAGLLAGLVYLTLPAVSLSSGIISTDVPLLTFWSLALFAFVMLVRQPAAWWPPILLGLALGLGLNAKYAMAYFVLCAVLYAIAVPQQRWIVLSARFGLALAIGIMMIAPNLLWNLENSFATFSHTADNAKWSGALGNPAKALEFFGAQFGVFGPILFAGLLIICWRAWRDGLRDADALLLSFAVPVILIVTVQAFISRAHANWAAVSYVAATILVTATMIRDLDWGWFRASLGLHVALFLGLGLATTYAGSFQLPNGVDPFARTLGWADTAAVVRTATKREEDGGQPVGAIIADGRALSAELLYYLRDGNTPIVTWRGNRPPKDHFQLVLPYAENRAEPVLFVTLGANVPPAIAERFGTVTALGRHTVRAGATKRRDVSLFRLSGFKPL